MGGQLVEYLKYYQTCTAPGFAVLVTGAWGTGKTFQVQAALPKTSRHYISLFGLKTAEEIHAEVAAAMDPTLAGLKKALNATTQMGNAAPNAWKLTGASSSLINSLIKTRTKNDKTIIFDDLERCSLPIRETLGVINQYVEHFGCRVVVIAHDEKLTIDFLEAKEKVFGQTIFAEPQIDAAFTSFCESVRSKARTDFLLKHKQQILSIFEQSGATSLRILKHVMEDITRLFDTLSTKHLGKIDAGSELLLLFCALDIETREGLTESDLRDRKRTEVMYRVGSPKGSTPETPRLVKSNQKYPNVDLNSELLADDVLVNVLIKGVYDSGEIGASLDRSIYFTPPSELPVWRVVMSFDELDDGIVQAAQTSMESEFQNRKFSEPGEILHVFALKLMMAENGVTPDALEQVRDQCKLYISDAVSAGTLPSRPNNWRWEDEHSHGYGGYGYWLTEKTGPFLNELHDDLNKGRVLAFNLTIPQIIADILDLTKNDGHLLYLKLNATHVGSGDYTYLPVLHHIAVSDFYDAWMSAPKNQWRYITNAIKSRATAARNGIGLDDEFAWYGDLNSFMTKAAENLSGFEALRITRAIPRV